jgi:hypothetical protein
MFNKTTFERRHNNENFDVAKHFTFILHDMVFVAVNDNAYVLHDIPPETYLSSRDIGDGRTVMWGLNDFIWLGYTLQNPRYEGRLLGRLSTIKIVQIGEEYTLAPGIRDSWQLLQTHLSDPSRLRRVHASPNLVHATGINTIRSITVVNTLLTRPRYYHCPLELLSRHVYRHLALLPKPPIIV